MAINDNGSKQVFQFRKSPAITSRLPGNDCCCKHDIQCFPQSGGGPGVGGGGCQYLTT